MYLRSGNRIAPQTCPCPRIGHLCSPIPSFNQLLFERRVAPLWHGNYDFIQGVWPPQSSIFHCYQCNVYFTEAYYLASTGVDSVPTGEDSFDRFFFDYGEFLYEERWRHVRNILQRR